MEETYHQNWVNKNPEYFKTYYENNKEQLKAYQKNYKLVNAKKIKAYQRKYMKTWWQNKRKSILEAKINKFKATLEPIDEPNIELKIEEIEPIDSEIIEQIIEPVVEPVLEPVVEKINLFATKNTDDWKPFYMR